MDALGTSSRPQTQENGIIHSILQPPQTPQSDMFVPNNTANCITTTTTTTTTPPPLGFIAKSSPRARFFALKSGRMETAASNDPEEILVQAGKPLHPQWKGAKKMKDWSFKCPLNQQQEQIYVKKQKKTVESQHKHRPQPPNQVLHAQPSFFRKAYETQQKQEGIRMRINKSNVHEIRTEDRESGNHDAKSGPTHEHNPSASKHGLNSPKPLGYKSSHAQSLPEVSSVVGSDSTSHLGINQPQQQQHQPPRQYSYSRYLECLDDGT
eukprot:TRINITY_DN1841_c0_g1_i6.p1 TRINITY_DN1841_c0_g1~~TRINITY_DN1841_c0_g1_i6.p1  ORF type:complete len:266 (+),score=64.52 TRINITY_DN1841_c0_g1_i6:55-852(+)